MTRQFRKRQQRAAGIRLALKAIAAAALTAPAAAIASPISTDGASSHSHLHTKGEIDEVQGPVLIEATYTGEVTGNLSGGAAKSARYLDNLDLVLEADLDRLAGWNGAELHVYALYNNGGSIGVLSGDMQGVSNIEAGTRALRLYEAWISQDLGSGLSVKAGLYDLNSEFDSLDSAGLFTHSAHGIGTDIAQSGRNGPSIFPVTSLAVRLAADLGRGWHLRGALLDGVPGDPDRPGRTAIGLGSGDGALAIGELEAPMAGGKLLLGYWTYTGTQDRIDSTRGTGARGFYLRGEAPLFKETSDADQGLDAFFRLGKASDAFHPFRAFGSLGFKYTGLFPGRDSDEAGIAVARAWSSRANRHHNGAAVAETAIEVTYRLALSGRFTIQPMVHFVANPSANPARKNALIAGLRFEVTARTSR